jgi:DNA-directed RNA polymerase subunit RPC12/RpoP
MNDSNKISTNKDVGVIIEIFDEGFRFRRGDKITNFYKNRDDFSDVQVAEELGVQPKEIAKLLLNVPKVVSEPQRQARRNGEISVQEALSLPDWDSDNHIYDLIRLEKNLEGERKIFVLKVYYEDGETHCELLPQNRFVTDTGMKLGDLNRQDLPLNEIYNTARQRISQYLYFTDDIYYDLVTLGAVSSYFREVFGSYPYFDFFGPSHGCGKTTALKCLVWTSFNGFFTLIPTPAVLFRTVMDTRGVMGIDEIDNLFKHPKQNLDILTLLDSGHTKGIMAFRMDMDAKPPQPIPYDPFGLKGFTRVGAIPLSLESRCITIKMIENKGFKQLKYNPIPADFEDIRGMLYNYRLRHSSEVKNTYENLSGMVTLNGRVRDLFLPLLTIAKLVSGELYNRVLEYAVAEDERKEATKYDPRILALLEMLDEENLTGRQKVVDITDRLNTKLREIGELPEGKSYASRTVITWLQSLGFERLKIRSKGYVWFDIKKTKLEQLVKVYLGTSPNLTQPHPTSPNLTPTSPDSPPGKEGERRLENGKGGVETPEFFGWNSAKNGPGEVGLGWVRFREYRVLCTECGKWVDLGLPEDVVLKTVKCPNCGKQGGLVEYEQIKISENSGGESPETGSGGSLTGDHKVVYDIIKKHEGCAPATIHELTMLDYNKIDSITQDLEQLGLIETFERGAMHVKGFWPKRRPAGGVTKTFTCAKCGGKFGTRAEYQDHVNRCEGVKNG